MREIKFRAWDKRIKKIIGIGNMQDRFTIRNDGELISGSNDLELMQYTGLKDKNGVEIYEGDIVAWGGETAEDCNGYGVVSYWDGDACFEIDDIKGATNGISQRNYNKVIGNIYENKELLNDN